MVASLLEPLRSDALAPKCFRSLLVLLWPMWYFIYTGLQQRQNVLAREHVHIIFFCEWAYSSRESFVCQRANSLSSFAFLIPAAMLAWHWGKLKNCGNRFNRRSLENLLCIWALCHAVIGNMALHGFCINGGYAFNANCDLTLLAIPFAHACENIFIFSKWRYHRAGFWLAFILASFCIWCPSWMSSIQDLREVILIVMSVAIVCIELACGFALIARGHPKCKEFWLRGGCAAFVFVGAQSLWQFGLNDSAYCAPRSWLQAHAVWHLGRALGALAIWEMMRCIDMDSEYTECHLSIAGKMSSTDDADMLLLEQHSLAPPGTLGRNSNLEMVS